MIDLNRLRRTAVRFSLVLVGVGLAGCLAITAVTSWWNSIWLPTVSIPADAGLPMVTFEQTLPALRNAPEVAWSDDGSLSISSASARPDFQVSTAFGDLLEVHSVPYLSRNMLSTHVAITQRVSSYAAPLGAPFQVVDRRDGRILFEPTEPVANSRAGEAINNNFRFAANGDRSIVAVGYGPRSSQLPITIYDTKTWRTLRTLAMPSPGPALLWSLEMSPDGRLLAYNSDDWVIVIDAESGTVLGRLPVPYGDRIAISPSNDMIAVAERGFITEANGWRHGVEVALHVFRLSNGTEIARRPQRRNQSVNEIVWDPFGRFVAWLDGGEPAIRLWNLQKPPEREGVIGLPTDILGSFALSPNGRRIAVGDGSSVDVFRIGP